MLFSNQQIHINTKNLVALAVAVAVDQQNNINTKNLVVAVDQQNNINSKNLVVAVDQQNNINSNSNSNCNNTNKEFSQPASLAPGFRFHPTDEELVQYYLKRKAAGKPFRFQPVSEVDVYKSEPFDLAGHSMVKNRDQEWYFFSPVDRKYGNGSRLNRATGQGYWKATGKDRHVRHKGQTIGMKKTLVFHGGRAPDGKRTNWVMHEYRLVDEGLERASVAQNKDTYVLCRIFQKSGLGPPTGDRYAPFVEEEWNDETALIIPGAEPGEEMANGDETQCQENEVDQHTHSTDDALLHQPELDKDSQNLALICKRERSDECPLKCMPENLSLARNKRPKHDDPNSSNGSEDSTTTPNITSNFLKSNTTPNLTSLEFPLLESLKQRDNQGTSSGVTFEAANLEKSVPPGYLKFISNLENGILNVSMEKETLKIEVMRAQAMINILQSHIDLLVKENEELRRAC